MPKERVVSTEVEGSPTEVADRLRRAGFEGTVDARGFELALTVEQRRRALNSSLPGRTRAEAHGTLEATASGTRVTVRTTMPSLHVWYFRVAFFAVPLALGVLLTTVLRSGDLADRWMLVPIGAYGLFAVGMATVGMGYNVWSANTQVEALTDAIVLAAGEARAMRVGAKSATPERG